jgi:hypothetical protein
MAIGRHQWFYFDEWDALATRKAGDLGDLFRSHNKHWVTLPVLAYRFLYWLFGLRSYFPYRLAVVVLYLATAALLLGVMRRAGVHPWIATAAASLFALFGAGSQNAIAPFQITFTGSLFLGLVFLLLADHDGPFNRRDCLAVLVGMLALMTSTVAVAMVAVVGIAVLLRRGWRVAMLLVAPLATCYLVWFVVIGHEGAPPPNSPPEHVTPGGVALFVGSGLQRTVRSMGPPLGRFNRAVVIVFVAVLVLGLLIAVGQRRRSGQLAQLAAPLALLSGTVVFLVIAASGRAARGQGYAGISRYVSVVAAMLLPALAVAAGALVTRWRWLLPAMMALFLIGIPQNLHAAARAQRARIGLDANVRQILESLPRHPLARQVPRSLRPESLDAWRVTIGWLLDGVEQGRIPAPRVISARDLASNNFRLSLYDEHGDPPTTNCRTARRPLVLTLQKGDAIGVSGSPILLAPAADPSLVNPKTEFLPSNARRVVVLRDIGRVLVHPTLSKVWPRICIGKTDGTHG